MSMNRKYPAIDILKLFSEGHYKHWNNWLTRCLQYENVEELRKTMYGLQAGMSDAQKKGLSSDKLSLFFVRLQTSIEKTVKKIYKKKYPNPLDDPNNAKKFNSYIETKRKRDQELEKFLRSASF
jgi:hypothetical protein